jgi:flagellar motility protein MotE (MotC chaperone)
MTFKRNKFTLILISAVLLGGHVISASTEPAPSASPSALPSAQPEEVKKAEPLSAAGCLVDSSILEDVKKRREELDIRQKDFIAKEAELDAREKALNESLKKLEAIREEIARAEEISKKDNEEKVSKLVETVQTMSPKAAAQLLSNIDEPLAVATMARMDVSKLAKVMNIMESGKSARLAESLAGVVRARKVSVSSDTAVTTMSAKGGEVNDGQNNNKESDANAVAGIPVERKPNSEKGSNDKRVQ